MPRIAIICVLAGLCACSNVSDFEQGLKGPEAEAWALCKKEFGIPVETTPPTREFKSDHILFSWNAEEARRNGGPILCRTDGTGTKLIELRVSTGF